MTQASAILSTEGSRDSARERDVIGRVAFVIAGILFAVGGILTYGGHLELSGLALFGGLAAAIASATQCPKRVSGWLGVVVLAAALAVVAIASVI